MMLEKGIEDTENIPDTTHFHSPRGCEHHENWVADSSAATQPRASTGTR